MTYSGRVLAACLAGLITLVLLSGLASRSAQVIPSSAGSPEDTTHALSSDPGLSEAPVPPPTLALLPSGSSTVPSASTPAPSMTAVTIPPAAAVNPNFTPPPDELTGEATWYSYYAGGAAAGPGLRSWLGPDWRGMTVRVCRGLRCIKARLTDWCACKGDRIIDLDAGLFAWLAPLSTGVLPVVIFRA